MSTHNIEAILRQDDWLRRMARSLVQDPHTADDLVQDAWLADLEGGEAARDKRSWLGVVMYRAGSKTFRTRRNQRERAESAAHLREHSASATDDVVGDRELRSLVAEELLALPEPQRTALHLVYVADLSVTEAGRRMGVAKSTASQRVDRGLEMLRQRIDSAYGGDRRSWCVALLPWASAARKAPATIGVPSLAAVVGVLAGVALVLGLAWLAWGHRAASPGAVVPAPTVAVAASPARPLAAPGLEPARAAVTVPVTVAEPDTAVRITARFLDSEGSAVTGATWSLKGTPKPPATQAAQEAPAGSVDWEDLSGEVDADGNLDASFESPLNYQFRLTVAAPGHATMSWAFRGIEPGEDKRLGTLELAPGFTLRGQIASPSGGPLTDRAWSVTADSAKPNSMLERVSTRVSAFVPEGQATFELAGLPAGDVSVGFWSEGQRTREPQVVQLPVATSYPHLFTIDLEATVSSRLRLSLDPRTGNIQPPVEPSSIHATAADGRVLEVVAANSRGTRFEVLDAMPAPISVTLSDPRFETWAAEIANPGKAKFVSLVGNASLELDVRDTQGNPVERYSVAFADVLRPGEFSSYENPVHDGKVALPGGLVEHVVPRSQRLIVRGEAGESVTTLNDLLPGERRVVTITLAPNARMTGTVNYAGGEPAMGVEVYLVRPALVDDSDVSTIMLGGGAGFGGEEWRMSVAQTLSDQEGRFEVELPDAGSYYVMANRPNRTWVLSDLRTPENQGEPVALVLPTGATLEGVIDLPEHLPKSGWAVFLGVADPRMAGGSRWRAPELDVDGKFHVEGLPAGETQVAITQEKVHSWSNADGPPATGFVIGSVLLVEGQTHQETFTFVNGAPALVTAELPQGEGLEGPVSVSFYRTGGERPTRRGRIQGSVESLGSCLLEPGAYVAAVTNGHVAILNGPIFSVPEAATHTVPIGVTVTERRIRVLGEGSPLLNQSVEFRSPQGPRARFKTDDEGWVTIRLDSGPLRARWRMMQSDVVWPPTSDQLNLVDEIGPMGD